MPSYAILGATGQTGQALLTILLQSAKDDVKNINLYVRSRARLERLQPEISTNKKVQIFEGSIQDVSLISRCISHVSAVFAVVASNENIPGLRIAQETAHTIVAALCELRAQDPDTKLPRIIVLSSATINLHLCRHMPALLYWLLRNAFSNVYADLVLAEEYLRLHRSWLNVTFVQPGGLVHDARRGHAISLDREETFLSYLDLAAGMIEVADAGELYDWKGVSVVSTADDVKTEWKVPLYMAKGLLWHFMPGLYRLSKFWW